MGVVTGEMLVDGRQRDMGFQRKTGYVQQQDLHLSTSTVREALAFSAILRQPQATPKAEKLAYVDEVIKLLEMESYADAVVGVPGEGLNVEQRKRLTSKSSRNVIYSHDIGEVAPMSTHFSGMASFHISPRVYSPCAGSIDWDF